MLFEKVLTLCKKINFIKNHINEGKVSHSDIKKVIESTLDTEKGW